MAVEVEDKVTGGGVVAPPVQGSINTTVTRETISQPLETEKDFNIPEAYKDKPYLKDVKNLDDIFKKLDGAQSLIGKSKINFPTEESTDEEIKAFNKAAGVPEKAEDYVFESSDKDRDTSLDDKIKELFLNSEITGRSATKLQTGFEALMKEIAETKKTESDEAFGKLTSEVFGDKADEVIASSRKLIEENLPEALEKPFTELSNEALTIVSAVLDSIKTKYIDEDNINDLNGSGNPVTVESLRKEGQALLDHPARNDPFHQDHKAINEKIKEVYAQIAKMS